MRIENPQIYCNRVLNYLEYIGAEGAMNWHPVSNEMKVEIVMSLMKSGYAAGFSHRMTALTIFSLFECARLDVVRVITILAPIMMKDMKES